MAAGFASVDGFVRNVPRAAMNDQSRFHRNQDGKGAAVCLGDVERWPEEKELNTEIAEFAEFTEKRKPSDKEIEQKKAARSFTKMPERGEKLLAVVDGDEPDDFKFLLAGGRGNFDFVADLAVEEGLADGRGGGDETLFGVRFLAALELVIDFDVALHVQQGEPGTVSRAVLRRI